MGLFHVTPPMQSFETGVDLNFDESTETLYLTNKSGDKIGVGTHISAGLSGIHFATETDSETGQNYILLLDGDDNELSRVAAASGGGGGGSGPTSRITMTSTTGWSATTVASGNAVPISFEWTSIADEIATGDGTLTISVGGSIRNTMNVAQGAVTVDVSPYLSAGGNAIRLTVTDSYGNYQFRAFNVNLVDLRLTSTFDASTVQTGEVSFPYIPYGEVAKTVHFILDGTTELDPVSTSVSGRQLTYIIPAQTHGAHSIRVYFTAVMNGSTVRSNELYYEVSWTEAGTSETIISSNFDETTVDQYTTVNIPYRIYNPQSQVANVTIKVNSGVVAELTNVDRTEQTFSYRMDDAGEFTISIISGGTTRTFPITVRALQIEAVAETEDLALYLTSSGRSNYEANPAVWTSGEGANQIAATFTGFNWISDGWQQDDDGITVLRIAGNGRVTIPYEIFRDDFRSTGKTIEVEFATREVTNYDAEILSCYSGGRGIKITSQMAQLDAEQNSLRTQYKEDEHVRISFVIEKRAETRLMYVYVNGIMSGTVQYDDGEDFAQLVPVGITIGSNACTTDIYNIRVYDNNLNRSQVLFNWIADTQNLTDLLSRYERNNVYDPYGNIVIEKLPHDLPYMIIECAELPQYKGDKKICSGEYVDPLHPEKSFTFTGAQFDVQGTSSQYYKRKNYKAKFNQGFVMSNNETVSKYKMRDDSIAVKTFCFKADVASSEGANNVELVRLYNDTCPYKTPAQVANSKVRQGIDGFPMVIFWRNTGEDSVSFLGKYNFNNDKSTEDVFGFTEGDESWEVLNNTSNRVLFKSDDYIGNAWLKDFEARFPDTDPPYQNPAQLAQFASWVRSTDPSAATGNALPESVAYPSKVTTTVQHVDSQTGAISYENVTTIENVVYTNDTVAYRLTKFKTELGDYVELQSALYYYLFTELFLMIDSRAKNMFPSFIGSVPVV